MSHPAALPGAWVPLTINGLSVTVPPRTTIFDAARINDIHIPALCHEQDKTPVGVCRMCVVDVGARTYAAACIREVEPGMTVKTNTEKVEAARKTLLELLMADHHAPCQRKHCELEELAEQYGATATPYPHRELTRGQDDSSHIILVDHSACILCDRCVRGCAELRNNFVIAREGKGYHAGIAFGLGQPMDSSGCISCGECMVSCPTGALTNKVTVKHKFESGVACSTEELKALEVFDHVSETFLNFNSGAVVKRELRKGEFFCREGEPGSTAFYILEGEVEISIRNPLAHVDTENASGGRMESRLVDRHEHPRKGESARRTHISVDDSVELAYDHPVAHLGPGTLFGEMACMHSYPRSATARAATDCTALELRRNVLGALQKNKTFRAKVDRDYLNNSLENHLRATPAFASLTPEFINELRQRVELLRYAPGQVIYKQGDLADGFYLVRRGFVKVSEDYPGGELVLAYLAAGNHFGEIALLGQGKHTATCSALEHVDVVRIAADEFKNMMQLFPEIHARLETVREEHLRQNQKRFSQVSDVPVSEFLRQGLMEAQSLLILDLDKCTRCDQCVKACADAHDGVTRLVRDGLRFDHYLIATSCRHCRDPRCMVCPVGAVHRGKSLDVVIDDHCIGCGECAKNCPYGNINIHEFDLAGEELAALGVGQLQAKKAVVRKATSCNLCEDRKEPSCVYACPHDAAHRVDNPEKFFREIFNQK